MKRILLLCLLLSQFAHAQTTTTITGTIEDLTQALVTSGKVTFTLMPSTDTVISGLARFSPQVVTCSINSSGQILNQSGSGACVITMNTALQPPGTYYRVDVWPYNVKTSSFTFYAVLSSYNWSTVVPTPTTSPAQNFVDIFSTQTIGGTKTFSIAPVFPNGFVDLSSTQTIGGAKTFSGNITVAGALVASVLNGVYVATQCGSSPVPSWCSGSDIGGWVNAAVAALSGSCGEVYIPAGGYVQATTMKIPRCVHLRGASGHATVLTFTPATGWAAIVADGQGAFNYPEGAIEDIDFVGPGAGDTVGGIYFGGSDSGTNSPSTAADPASNYGDFFNVNRVRIFEFGTGIQFGTNAYSITILESLISNNGVGVNFPATAGTTPAASGERISLIGCSIQNSSSIGVEIGNSVNTDIEINNTAIDYNTGFGIQNGTTTAASNATTVNLVSVHMETLGQQIQNFGQMSVVSSEIIGGANVTNYLIDNEGFLYLLGDNITNANTSGCSSAACPIFNPAQAGNTVALGNTATTPISSVNTIIDPYGNASFQGAFSVTSPFGSYQQSSSFNCETGYGITTINTGAAATSTGLTCLRPNSIIDAIVYRVTTTITTAASFTVGDSGSATRYSTCAFSGGTQSLAAGATGVCNAGYYQTGNTALPVKLTFNTTPGAGTMRVIVYFHTWGPPTS